MPALSDRAFKVRSGKIIRAVEALDPKTFNDVSELQCEIDSIVDNYFTADQASQFVASEFGDRYAEVVAHATTAIIVKGTGRKSPIEATITAPAPRKRTKKKAVKKKVHRKKASRRPTVATRGRRRLTVAEAPKKPARRKKKAPKGQKADIVFSFDDTGSMAAARHITRQLIDEISADLLVEFGDKLNVGVMVHGDYCDPGDPVASLPMTQDWVKIKRFLNADRDYMGGDAPECYELVLHECQDFDWRAKSQKILVLIGDDEPHHPGYHLNHKGLDWRHEIDCLAAMGVQVVSVQALNRRHADYFYKEIARATDGYHLQLTQLNQTAELIRAICYNSFGELAKYESTKKVSSPAFRRNLDVLAGRATTVEKVEGLSEFQMFEITKKDHDIRIRDFVEKMGMKYTKGCGYYEFMKPETVQEYKKVVVQDRETEVFHPDAEGRALLGLPSHGSVRINPKNFDDTYRFFIQSTSYTRKLKAGTTFLYDDRES